MNSPDVNLNLNVRGLPLSATLFINELSNKLKREGRPIYKLGLGQSPFPVPQPVVDELITNAYQKDYLPVLGLYSLREAVVDYYRRSQNLEYSSENILVGPGSKELMFIIQLVYYGDLIIPTPSWVSYAPQAHIVGRHVYWLSTKKENRWLLTPEELDRHCRQDPTRPRLLILNYPNNPTGMSYNRDELKGLAQVAEKYKVLILSDEIYGELNFNGNHTSIAKYYPEGTIISSGLSKWCGAGGWRLGTFIFPENLKWLLEGMSAVASETFTSTSAPIQYAGVRAFKGGMKIERYLCQSRRVLKSLADSVYQRLYSAGADVSRPDGAFYMFPDFSKYKESFRKRGISNSREFCEKLLNETGVAILPGSAFGRPENEFTARIAYVDFDGSRALAAAEQIPFEQEIDERFHEYYCERVLKAVDLLCEFVAN
ncbi:pyridoxal phosphate-dependent aminotransferase [Flexistipes sp.]|uniref:pyridoxal phosphate-dependent aminotransferase n=1 Tax=Flexistipes sp. TaxID=3088135 RepID=UPI002E1BCA86|nr:aminotransferase class I/II-fold pyridoxal phosphate-dependent enzyme [Flexistipes sp.]